MKTDNKVLRKTIAYMQKEAKSGKPIPKDVNGIHRHILIANGKKSSFGNGKEASEVMELLGLEEQMCIKLIFPQNQYADWRVNDPNDPRAISAGRALEQLRAFDIMGDVCWNPLAVAAALEADKFAKAKRLEEMSEVKCNAGDKKILANWTAANAPKKSISVSNSTVGKWVAIMKNAVTKRDEKVITARQRLKQSLFLISCLAASYFSASYFLVFAN